MKRRIVPNIIIVVAIIAMAYVGFNTPLYDVVLPNGLNTVLLKALTIYMDIGFVLMLLLNNITECKILKNINNIYKKITSILIGFVPAIIMSIGVIASYYFVLSIYIIKNYGLPPYVNNIVYIRNEIYIIIAVISTLVFLLTYKYHDKICNFFAERIFEKRLTYNQENAKVTFESVSVALTIFLGIFQKLSTPYLELSMLAIVMCINLFAVCTKWSDFLPQEQ